VSLIPAAITYREEVDKSPEWAWSDFGTSCLRDLPRDSRHRPPEVGSLASEVPERDGLEDRLFVLRENEGNRPVQHLLRLGRREGMPPVTLIDDHRYLVAETEFLELLDSTAGHVEARQVRKADQHNTVCPRERQHFVFFHRARQIHTDCRVLLLNETQQRVERRPRNRLLEHPPRRAQNV